MNQSTTFQPIPLQLDLRDYFAAKAMQYFLDEEHMCDQKDIADAAYSMANSMIKARGEA